MKGKDIWTTRYYCEYNELDSLAEFLEDKIAAGWELTSYKGASFGFRKAEPRQVQISVELVEDADDEAAKESFIEYCESDGWKHIFDGGKLQFFEHEDLDAEPIHTDAEVKLKMVHRKCLTSRILLNVLLIVGVMAAVWMNYQNFDYRDLFSCDRFFTLLVFPWFVPLLLISTCDYVSWYCKAKGAIQRGLDPVYRRSKMSKYIDRFSILLMILCLWGDSLLDSYYAQSKALMLMILFMVGGTCLFIFFYDRWDARYNNNRKRNLGHYIAFAVVFVLLLTGFASQVFVPSYENEECESPFLTIDELDISSDGSRNQWAYVQGSPMAKWEDGEDRYGSRKIYYDLYTTKYKKAYDMILQQRFFDWDDTYQEVTEPVFGANKVYLMGQAAGLTQWLLLYDEDILYLETNNIDLTEEQKAVIASKFAD